MDAYPDIVDAVLWFLGALSLLIWAIALAKFVTFRRNAGSNRRFLAEFERVQDTDQLHAVAQAASGSLARLGSVAAQEVAALRRLPELVDAARRDILLHALRQQAHAEQTRMESGLGVLASVGATAPFIGLFGTVWGIMNALKNISAAGSAGLDVVAGPIGEALIATAIGIATAVPAVLAYNYYLRQVRLSAAGMEHFAGAFLGLLAKCDAQGK